MVKASPSKAGVVSLIPGQGVKFPHTSWPKNQNIKQKQYCNKLNKDFKIGPLKKNVIFENYVHRSRLDLMIF